MAKYLLTGACGGMGRAIYDALCGDGDEVWGIDLAPRDDTRRIIAADVTDSASLEAAFERVSAEAGELDGVIHAAGIYDLFSLAEIDEETIKRDFDVNLLGVYRVNKLFLPLIKKGGRVVIISSELAPLDPLPFTGIYALTKSALEKYADSLRMELRLIDRRVIVVRPGAVRTGMLPRSVEKLDEFCEKTKLYALNAARFRKIVDRVESKSVPPEKLAKKVLRALRSGHPKLVYKLNRNPLLLMLNALPRRAQLGIIKRVLK
ncbi:MAG: SDR family NAD(P)-dependent oxidoreductase [Clostridia bacterium]|nr:SDR family NAD(P)-dependent oxidoreductase [Clostridia bacterium]